MDVNTRLLQSVLKHAAALADGSSESDAALLRRFASSRDPAAFAELVRRYGRLVWSVCRQLRPTDADAEDAFQATFLVLLRSAGSVRTTALGPFLHTVAHRVACKAGRADGRRRKREQIAATPDRDVPVPPSAWDSLAAAVHEEVAKLPEHLRVPFVLCCLEGRGTTDAAKHLGWKLGTLSGRLTRAKQTLLDRLARRGLPAAAVAVTFAALAVPVAVAAKALDLIHLGESVPTTVLELAKGATTMTKTKLLAAGLLIAVGLTASVGGWLTSADAQTPDIVKDQIELLRQIAVAHDEKLNEKKPAAKWEYFYQQMHYDKTGRPAGMRATEFEKLLEAMDADGWQYVGQADIAQTGPPLPSHVFRRAKGTTSRGQTVTGSGALYSADRIVLFPPSNPALAAVRDVILQRMRKDPAETFAAALATKLKASPELAATVEKHGRSMLEVEVLSTLLQEARQKPVEDGNRPRGGVGLPGLPNPLTLPGGGQRPAPEAAKRNDDAVQVQKVRDQIDAFRARKPITFEPADFGISAAELQVVLREVVQQKYGTGAQNPITLTLRTTTTGPGPFAPVSEYVEAAGPADHLRWLTNLMDGVKAKPKK